MSDGFGSSITVRGDGNIVAGRDINVGSSIFSVEQVPPEFREEFQVVKDYVSSLAPVDKKRSKVLDLGADLTVSGFGAAAGAIVTYLLALI